MPQAPFMRNAVSSSGRCQPPPMGRPLSGITTIRATTEGKMAPKIKTVIQ